jgi:hypothetical protein
MRERLAALTEVLRDDRERYDLNGTIARATSTTEAAGPDTKPASEEVERLDHRSSHAFRDLERRFIGAPRARLRTRNDVAD